MMPDVWDSVLTWILARDPVATLCLGLLIAVGAGVWRLASKIIPEQVASIQASQKQLADAYLADRKQLTAEYLADKQELRRRHHDDLQLLSTNFSLMIERLEKIAQTQERLVRDLVLRDTRGAPS